MFMPAGILAFWVQQRSGIERCSLLRWRQLFGNMSLNCISGSQASETVSAAMNKSGTHLCNCLSQNLCISGWSIACRCYNFCLHDQSFPLSSGVQSSRCCCSWASQSHCCDLAAVGQCLHVFAFRPTVAGRGRHRLLPTRRAVGPPRRGHRRVKPVSGLERGRRLVGGGRQSVGALRMASLCGGVYARAGHRGIRVQANQTRHHCQNTLGSCWLWAFRGRTKSRASDQAYKTRHHCQSKTTAPKDWN
jgi:hypothetical protein